MSTNLEPIRADGGTHQNGSQTDRRLPAIRGSFGDWIGRIAAVLRDLGPYVAIELLLPGGSLTALLLWLYRRNALASFSLQLRRIATGAAARMTSANVAMTDEFRRGAWL